MTEPKAEHETGRQATLHECNQMLQRQWKNARLEGDALRDAIARASYAAWRCWRDSHGEKLPKWGDVAPGIREDFIGWSDDALSKKGGSYFDPPEVFLVWAVAAMLSDYRHESINRDGQQGTGEATEAKDDETLQGGGPLPMTDEDGSRASENATGASTDGEFSGQEVAGQDGAGKDSQPQDADGSTITPEAGTESVDVGAEPPPNSTEAYQPSEGSDGGVIDGGGQEALSPRAKGKSKKPEKAD